mgnify:CR=1 FL=1
MRASLFMKKFENYCLNLKVLAKAKNEDLNNEFIVSGIIYKFFVQFAWLSMLKARNDMSHIYDGNAARNLVNLILDNYIPEFIKLKDEIQAYYGDILDNL